jgi:hypothetical protein
LQNILAKRKDEIIYEEEEQHREEIRQQERQLWQEKQLLS